MTITWLSAQCMMHRWIFLNGFEEARSETQRAKVGGPMGREWGWDSWGAPSPPARESGSTESSSTEVWGGTPAAKRFSRILNTQDDLSGQQDYGPLAKHKKNTKISHSIYVWLNFKRPNFGRMPPLASVNIRLWYGVR